MSDSPLDSAIPPSPISDGPAQGRFGFLERAPFGFAVFDRDWRTVFVNAEGARLVGGSREQFYSQPITELFPESGGNNSLHEAIRRCLADGQPIRAEHLHAGLDRWLELQVFPVEFGLAVQFSDTTERRRTAIVAEQDRRELRRASRLAGLASFRWTAQDNRLWWSPEYYELIGVDPEHFTPDHETFRAHVHPDDVQRLEQQRAVALQGQPRFDVEFRLQHADGTWRWMHSVSEIEYDAHGRAIGIFGTVHDRTDEQRVEEERVRLERQVQQAQKLESLGVLAGGIAHDFNNLLVGILANASLARSTSESPDFIHECLGEVEQAARRAAELTNQLLAYAGKGKFVIEPVNLSVLVSEMLTLLRAAMNRKAELHLDLARDLPLVAAAATQMRQVVMNLLTNASDALEDQPGTIVLRTGVQHVDAMYRASTPDEAELADGRYVFLEVSDTGVGMDAETKAHIFDPFFTTKQAGRGLGLAATMGIVRNHQGAIRIYSERGKGTSFKLLFPVGSGLASVPPQPAATGPWHGSGTVLIIDDDAAVRRVTRRVLERSGFQVLEASDGEAGVTAFREARESIVLVLLDLTMPRVDGEETFRRLRTVEPTVRIVMMSGYNAQNVTTQFVGKGLAGFVQKPFDTEQLLSQVRGILER